MCVCMCVRERERWSENIIGNDWASTKLVVCVRKKEWESREARWHIDMSPASGSEGPHFKPEYRLKIYQIRNDAGSLRFKMYNLL